LPKRRGAIRGKGNLTGVQKEHNSGPNGEGGIEYSRHEPAISEKAFALAGENFIPTGILQ